MTAISTGRKGEDWWRIERSTSLQPCFITIFLANEKQAAQVLFWPKIFSCCNKNIYIKCIFRNFSTMSRVAVAITNFGKRSSTLEIDLGQNKSYFMGTCWKKFNEVKSLKITYCWNTEIPKSYSKEAALLFLSKSFKLQSLP